MLEFIFFQDWKRILGRDWSVISSIEPICEFHENQIVRISSVIEAYFDSFTESLIF